MRRKTTVFLLLAVFAVGAYIWFVDRAQETSEQKREAARRALRVDPDAVSSLAISANALDLQCEFRDRRWLLVRPVAARADASAIGAVLDAMRELPRAETITADEQKAQGLTAEAYGLSPPRARIAWRQDGTEAALLIGRDAPLPGRMYVQLEGQGDILATDTNLINLLPHTVTDFREHRVLTGMPSDITRVDIKRGDGFLQFSRPREGEWRIQKPLSGRAALGPMQTLLDRLFDLRVTEFIADSTAAISLYGLDEPVVQVTLAGESGTDQSLMLGRPIESRTNEIYAAIAGQDAVFAVSNNILDLLRTPLPELRDRSVVPFSAHEIARIQIERGEQTLVLQTTNSADWQVVQPRRYAADTANVQLLLGEWAGARYVRFHDDAATNEATWGFSPDPLRITFSKQALENGRAPQADGDAVRIVIGRETDGDTVAVRVGNEPFIGEVPRHVLELTRMDPLFFRNRIMLKFDPAAVRALQLQTNGSAQSIERDASNTFFAAAATAVVNSAAIANDLAQMSNLRALRLVQEDPKSLAAFGLANPMGVLTVELRGTDALGKTLLLGGDDSDGSCFAMVKGQDVVFTIEKAVRDILLTPLYKSPVPTELTDDHGTGNQTDADP